MAEKKSHEELYGIGAVAKLTGLTDHTIRVWERRYGAVVARRAANRRREYTETDVEKLRLLKRLTDEGIAISQIANLTPGKASVVADTDPFTPGAFLWILAGI